MCVCVYVCVAVLTVIHTTTENGHPRCSHGQHAGIVVCDIASVVAEIDYTGASG